MAMMWVEHLFLLNRVMTIFLFYLALVTFDYSHSSVLYEIFTLHHIFPYFIEKVRGHIDRKKTQRLLAGQEKFIFLIKASYATLQIST